MSFVFFFDATNIIHSLDLMVLQKWRPAFSDGRDFPRFKVERHVQVQQLGDRCNNLGKGATTWGMKPQTQGTRTGVRTKRTCTLTVFIVFSLGILGDNLPLNTHYIGLIGISHDGVRW